MKGIGLMSGDNLLITVLTIRSIIPSENPCFLAASLYLAKIGGLIRNDMLVYFSEYYLFFVFADGRRANVAMSAAGIGIVSDFVVRRSFETSIPASSTCAAIIFAFPDLQDNFTFLKGGEKRIVLHTAIRFCLDSF